MNRAPRKPRVHIPRRDAVLAVVFGVLVIAADVGGAAFGNVHSRALQPKITAWSGAALVLVAGVILTRRVAHIFGHIVEARTLPAAGAAIRVITTAIGYVLVLIGVFEALSISVERLVVGGALTGVIIGIAAQQSLGNVFAGLVILMARPFAVGEHVRIRSGALGGILEGYVMAMSLTYVTLLIDDAPLKIPNSVMLSVGVGPTPPKAVTPESISPPPSLSQLVDEPALPLD